MRAFGIGALTVCGGATPLALCHAMGWIDSWQSVGIGVVASACAVFCLFIGAVIATIEDRY